jgi:hypothetical protein
MNGRQSPKVPAQQRRFADRLGSALSNVVSPLVLPILPDAAEVLARIREEFGTGRVPDEMQDALR